MKPVRTLLVACGLVAALAGVFALAQAPVESAGAVGSESRNRYVPLDQVDSTWHTVVDDYPEPLPDGLRFPDVFPADVTPDEGDKALVDEVMISGVAALYWRCAWLDVAVQEEAGTRATSVYSGLSVDEKLAISSSLPGNPESRSELSQYREWLTQEAAEKGTTVNYEEFTTDCDFYEGVKANG